MAICGRIPLFSKGFRGNTHGTELFALATAATFVATSGVASTYWNVFNIEGEDEIGADIVWYNTFEDMLNDDNRAGVGQTNAFGGGYNANIVDSGSDGTRFWNVFNIEGEDEIGADIVWYNSLEDMLNDDNRAGVGQTNAFGGGYNANIVGSGSDGTNYWNVFNIEGEDEIGADIVWYNTFEDMLNDDNRAGVGQTNAFGGGYNANIVVPDRTGRTTGTSSTSKVRMRSVQTSSGTIPSRTC